MLQAKANDGEGPEILRSTQVGGTGHAECLAATLVEHRQHLASIQVVKWLHTCMGLLVTWYTLHPK